MTELDAVGFAAVLAADADLEVGPRRPSLLDADLHQPADAVEIDHLEWVLGNDVVLHVMADERTVVVPTHAEPGLGEVVGAEREELRLLGDLVGDDASPGQL